jgi:2-polyprenyl-3-methyl-5-hydroxy-6-metoxy-1,4-benzoquinol methylase
MDYKDKANVYYELARPEMLAFIPSSAKKILDVGCGTGRFGMDLKKQDPTRRVDGIEPNLPSVQIAREKLDNVFEGSIESYFEQYQSNDLYDCIVFNDVLEHLYNPGEVLKSCKKLLNNGGVIVSSIPNIRYFPVFIQYIKQAEWKYAEAGVMDFTHLRFFTKKSMIRLYKEAGYYIEMIEGINPTASSVYPIFNLITIGKFPDVKFQQFAIRAHIM